MGSDLDPCPHTIKGLANARLQLQIATLEQHPAVVAEELLLHHLELPICGALQQQLLGSEHQLQLLAHRPAMRLVATNDPERRLHAVAVHHLGSQIVDPAEKLRHEAVLRAAIELLWLAHLFDVTGAKQRQPIGEGKRLLLAVADEDGANPLAA